MVEGRFVPLIGHIIDEDQESKKSTFDPRHAKGQEAARTSLGGSMADKNMRRRLDLSFKNFI